MKSLYKHANVLVLALLFAGIGTIMVMQSMAATPTVVAEPETGTASGSARLVSDAAASGGRAVAFSGTAGPVTVHNFPTDGTAWNAHRGGGNAPYLWFDGSMTAFRNSVAAGADLLDLDMQATKDGVLVAMHDTTVDRTTSGTGLVSSFNYADLPPLDMRNISGEGWPTEKVPTIDQVLNEFGGKVIISIEAKDASDITPLARMIKAKGLQDSMFINVKYSRGEDVKAIKAAGIYPHVWGLSTSDHIRAADSQGAFLIELPYNVSSSLITTAQSSANIKRWVAGPIYKLNKRAAMTPGLHGYVSDAHLYLDRVPLDQPTATSITPQLAERKIGPGWRTVYPSSISSSLPMFNSRGLVLHDGTNYRRVQMGNLNGTRPASGSMTFKFILGATTDTARSDFRVMLPREEGNGTDANSRGYVVGLRKNGQMVMWTAPVSYGAGISLGTRSTPRPGDTEEVILRFDWTATTVKLTRLNSSGGTVGTIGPVNNTDWRGPDIMVSAKGTMVLTGLEVSGN